eukprot:3861529-Alexandrium_andersonii.AAC.1
MWGSHMIKRWPTAQKTAALSSGEAELAGITKGAVEGVGLVSVARDLAWAASSERVQIAAQQLAFAAGP